MSWVWFRATADHFSFLYFYLVISSANLFPKLSLCSVVYSKPAIKNWAGERPGDEASTITELLLLMCISVVYLCLNLFSFNKEQMWLWHTSILSHMVCICLCRWALWDLVWVRSRSSWRMWTRYVKQASSCIKEHIVILPACQGFIFWWITTFCVYEFKNIVIMTKAVVVCIALRAKTFQHTRPSSFASPSLVSSLQFFCWVENMSRVHMVSFCTPIGTTRPRQQKSKTFPADVTGLSPLLLPVFEERAWERAYSSPSSLVSSLDGKGTTGARTVAASSTVAVP